MDSEDIISILVKSIVGEVKSRATYLGGRAGHCRWTFVMKHCKG